MNNPVYGGAGDAASLGDLSEALPVQAIPEDGFTFEIERATTDVPAFQACAPHAGTHSFDDQIALEFGNGADDDDGSAQGPPVSIFSRKA